MSRGTHWQLLGQGTAVGEKYMSIRLHRISASREEVNWGKEHGMFNKKSWHRKRVWHD